jgi:hypothetical protein
MSAIEIWGVLALVVLVGIAVTYRGVRKRRAKPLAQIVKVTQPGRIIEYAAVFPNGSFFIVDETGGWRAYESLQKYCLHRSEALISHPKPGQIPEGVAHQIAGALVECMAELIEEGVI